MTEHRLQHVQFSILTGVIFHGFSGLDLDGFDTDIHTFQCVSVFEATYDPDGDSQGLGQIFLHLMNNSLTQILRINLDQEPQE